MTKNKALKLTMLIFALVFFISVFVAGIVLRTSTTRITTVNSISIPYQVNEKSTLADSIVVSGTSADSLKPNIDGEKGRLGFSYSLPSNAEIIKVYQSPIGSDVKSLYTDYEKHSISLYYEKNGSTRFQIFVRVKNFVTDDEMLNTSSFEEFDFQVTIGGGTPAVSANVTLGGKISQDLALSYNPHEIYLKLGACTVEILERDTNSSKGTYQITSTSSHSTVKQKLSLEDGTYDIKIVGADGAMYYWTSITYSTPLNVTAVILIVVGIIGAGIIVVSFILLRTRMKVR